MRSKEKEMTVLGEQLLQAGPGSEVKLSSFLMCHEGHYPVNFEEVEEHHSKCLKCLKRYKDSVYATVSGKYINSTGWWDPNADHDDSC